MRQIPSNQPSCSPSIIIRPFAGGRTSAHTHGAEPSAHRPAAPQRGADQTGDVVVLPVQWRETKTESTPGPSAAPELAWTNPTKSSEVKSAVTAHHEDQGDARQTWLTRMWRFSDTSPAHAAAGFLVFHGGPCDTTIAADLDASLRAHIRDSAPGRRGLSHAQLGAAGAVLRQRLANLDAGQRIELAERISLAEKRVVGSALLRSAENDSRGAGGRGAGGRDTGGRGAGGRGADRENTAHGASHTDAAAIAREVVAQSTRWRAWLTNADAQRRPPSGAPHRTTNPVQAPAERRAPAEPWPPEDPGGADGCGYTPHPIFGWDVAAEITDATLDVMDDLLR